MTLDKLVAAERALFRAERFLRESGQDRLAARLMKVFRALEWANDARDFIGCILERESLPDGTMTAVGEDAKGLLE